MKRILFFVLAIIAFSAQSFAQVAPNFNIYMIETRFNGDAMEDYFASSGYDRDNVQIMMASSFAEYPEYTTISRSKIRDFLNKYYPSSTSKGWLVLDWEEEPYTDLRNYPVTDSRFKNAEAKILQLISEVKSYRPNVNVSMYGITYRTWNTWQYENYNPAGKYDRIVSNLDFLTPSVYNVYADETVGHERNLRYLRENLTTALKYGKKHNKPVLPFFWHRIHFNDPNYGREIMKKETLAKYVKLIQTFSYDGYKASGAFWWDNVSGRLENLKGINGHLNGTVYNEATYDAMIINYAKHIKYVLNDGASSSPDPSPTAQKVVSYTLFDASTKKDIRTLENGATLDLSTLPTKNLNIRANTYPATVGSVKFSLSGSASKSATESNPSYDLMGDNGAWVPSAGSYTLKATPYTSSGGSGTAGTALSIGFNVVTSGASSTGSRGESFTLINSDTNRDIITIANGATINLSSLPTKNLNIRFNKGTISMASVKLTLSGAQSKSIVENIAPYALYADNTDGNYYAWTPPTGSYTLKATPYSGTKASGTAGTSYSINFTVSNSLSATSSSNLSADSASLSFKAIDGVVAYPNPATSLINVEASETGEGVSTINIYNLDGKVMITQEEKTTASGLKTAVDINSLRQGLYILEVITPKGRSSQRIVVE
ncbi:T9SS type A sorting domain-containing protein [Pontibacter saemangeumensis]